MPPPPAKKFAFASSQASSATANNLDGEGGPPLPLGRVLPKVVTIARPPRMLKVEHLTDPKRGIASLPRELIVEGGPSFKGKGHELEDLRLLLSRAKHWAHRLFPRITFEDFVERAEGLGSKRPLRNHLTRIRHGMPLSFGTTNEDGEVVGVNSDEDEEDVVRVGDDNQGPAVNSSAAAATAAEQEDNNNSSSSTSELKFDRLFREFSSTIAAASSSTQRPPPPPPRLTTTIEKVAEDEEGEEDEDEKKEEEEKAAQKAAEEGSASEEITADPPAQSQQQQQQSSTSKQQQQEEEEFDMDDDDFDEDFLSSFKP